MLPASRKHEWEGVERIAFSAIDMPLTPGTSLGHYDVTALVGEGGMGEGLASHRYPAPPREEPPRNVRG